MRLARVLGVAEKKSSARNKGPIVLDRRGRRRNAIRQRSDGDDERTIGVGAATITGYGRRIEDLPRPVVRFQKVIAGWQPDPFAVERRDRPGVAEVFSGFEKLNGYSREIGDDQFGFAAFKMGLLRAFAFVEPRRSPKAADPHTADYQYPSPTPSLNTFPHRR